MAETFSEYDRAVSESSVWSVSGHALSIEYLPILLDEIRAYAMDGLNRIRHGGVEVGGVLYGVRDGDRIRILGWRPLDCEHAEGPGFVLSQNDEAALDRLTAEPGSDPRVSGLQPVGWFHSHTRSGVFLSDSDLAIYDRHFPQPWQIAMVVRPSPLGPAEVGFFFREPDGKVHSETSYSPFTVTPLLTPAASPKRDVEPVFSILPAQPPPARVPPRILPLPYPRAEIPTTALSRANWLWISTAIVLALLGIGVLTGVFHDSGGSPGKPGLNLRAYDHAGQVRIEWDRSARPIVSGGKASLFITDGDQVIVTEVSPELLRDGSIVYERKSPNVEVRLSVTNAGSEPVQERTKLIGLSAASSTPVERANAGDRAAPIIVKEPAAAPEQAAPPSPDLPMATELQVAAEKPSVAHHGPTAGRLIWNGNLNAGASLQIDGGRASTGHLTGRLPEQPVKVKVHPASFAGRGIEVYADELPSAKERREQASASNGLKTVFKRNPKLANDVVVTETPSAQNKWKRIGVRAKGRRVSVIVVDWRVTTR
jgi:proteasome lid subunit RPN8/RPN11